MNHYYEDLLDLTDKEPLWYDECGVPRWCKFAPDEANNLYAHEVALIEIRCQHCARVFQVCMAYCEYEVITNQFAKPLVEYIKRGILHYGDPPAHLCTGDSMNCIDVRVLEYWKKGPADFIWHRSKSLEVPLRGYK